MIFHYFYYCSLFYKIKQLIKFQYLKPCLSGGELTKRLFSYTYVWLIEFELLGITLNNMNMVPQIF